MTTDYTKSQDEIIVQLVNDENSLHLKATDLVLDDVFIVADPVPGREVFNNLRTGVKINPAAHSGYTNSQTVRYNRVHLRQIFPTADAASVQYPVSTDGYVLGESTHLVDLLDAINSRYGINIKPAEVFDLPLPTFSGPPPYDPKYVRLEMRASHKVFIGGMQLRVLPNDWSLSNLLEEINGIVYPTFSDGGGGLSDPPVPGQNFSIGWNNTHTVLSDRATGQVLETHGVSVVDNGSNPAGLLFEANDSFVTLPAMPAFTLVGDFTVSFRLKAKLAPVGDSYTVFDTRADNDPNYISDYLFAIFNYGDSLNPMFFPNLSSYLFSMSSYTYHDEKKHRFDFVRKNGVMYVYSDGHRGSERLNYPQDIPCGPKPVLGYKAGLYYNTGCAGELSEFKIFDHAKFDVDWFDPTTEQPIADPTTQSTFTGTVMEVSMNSSGVIEDVAHHYPVVNHGVTTSSTVINGSPMMAISSIDHYVQLVEDDRVKMNQFDFYDDFEISFLVKIDVTAEQLAEQPNRTATILSSAYRLGVNRSKMGTWEIGLQSDEFGGVMPTAHFSNNTIQDIRVPYPQWGRMQPGGLYEVMIQAKGSTITLIINGQSEAYDPNTPPDSHFPSGEDPQYANTTAVNWFKAQEPILSSRVSLRIGACYNVDTVAADNATFIPFSVSNPKIVRNMSPTVVPYTPSVAVTPRGH